MAEMTKAFAKYGWSMPKKASVASVAPVNATERTGGEEGTISAQPQENDVEFLCPVQVGDHQFMLDFDTGSSDL